MAASASQQVVYWIGRFRLDTAQRILEEDGKLVPVPPKALDMLIYLVRQAGGVVDKDSLFRTVWPDTCVVESSLTRNICVLRKVLDEPGRESVIQTVSKRGYRFVGAVRNAPPDATRRKQWLLGLTVLLMILAGGTYSAHRNATPDKPLAEADRLYRIGRYMWSKFDPENTAKALEQFQKAAEIDAGSALAQSGIADARMMRVILGMGGAADLERAREAAQRALQLEPAMAAPHVSMGWVHVLADFKMKEAERDFRRALALDARSAPAHYTYSCLLAHSGRLGEARVMIGRARDLDPVSPVIGVQAARIEYYDRRYQRAVDLLRDVLNREPSFRQAHYYLAMTLGEMGRTKEAREQLLKAQPHRSLLATDQAWLDSIEGNRRAARELIAQTHVRRVQRERAGYRAGHARDRCGRA